MPGEPMNTDKLPEIDPTAPGMKIALRMLRHTVQLEAQRVKEPDYIFGESEERAMLYLHGGGFYLPAQAYSLRLAEKYAKSLTAPYSCRNIRLSQTRARMRFLASALGNT